MKILTIGAGAWGLALSNVLSENFNEVFVFSRNEKTIEEINNFHTSNKYLPSIILNNKIIATSNFDLINEMDYLLIAVPSKAIKDVIELVSEKLHKKIKIINATKGLEYTTNTRIQEYISTHLSSDKIENICSILGPGFALEVCKHNLTCLNSVSTNFEVAKEIQTLFSNEYFRVYVGQDVIGSEYGTSIKNAIAIASGIIKGLGYDENTKAALITRGLAEMTRFGIHKGAKKDTFFGLTGVGDLVLTCNSTESRNFAFGYKVGKENDARKVINENKTTVEGLNTIKVVHNISKADKIEMPIIDALYQILFEYKPIKETILALMTRPLKVESFD